MYWQISSVVPKRDKQMRGAFISSAVKQKQINYEKCTDRLELQQHRSEAQRHASQTKASGKKFACRSNRSPSPLGTSPSNRHCAGCKRSMPRGSARTSLLSPSNFRIPDPHHATSVQQQSFEDSDKTMEQAGTQEIT